MKLLRIFGIICYVASSLLGLGLAVDFVISLLRWDFSPWWFWPAGFGAVFLMMVIAANIFRLKAKTD